MAVGDRLYGYVPMSSHLHLTPGPVRGDYLRDVSPHRLGLPPAYNAYQVVEELPLQVSARRGELGEERPDLHVLVEQEVDHVLLVARGGHPGTSGR